MAASNHAVQALVSQVSELTTQLQSLQTESLQQPTASNPPVSSIPDVHQVVCLCQRRYGPMSFDGVIVPRWLVILGESYYVSY